MTKLLYWRDYDKPFTLIFWLLIILFLGLSAAIVVIQTIGVNNLIPWNVLTLDSSYFIDFKIFGKGPFSFSIPAENKVLTEFFSGGTVPTALPMTRIMMVATIVAILLYLALVTYFKRIWYLIAMAGLLVFLVLLNIESLAFFGWTDYKGLAIVFIVLLTPSYYLHAFAESAGLIKRLWVISLAVLLLLVMAYFFGESNYGSESIYGYGLLAPYILIILFIVTVAHEIIASFINAITGSDGIADSTKLRHFLIISLIYLVNILMSYLYVAHYIDWQLIFINPFVLLVISAVLGIWGSRARASLYVGASRLEALWPILYLVIGIISMGTLTYLMLSVNDPMLKVLSDISIYAHLGIGVAFVLYILYNFINLIEEGYKLKNVLYNPTNLPYLTYRLMGLLIVVALFAVRGFQYPSWYTMGGYYNANADIEMSIGNKDVAEAYYLNGNTYAYHNHKSNYNLAMIYQDDQPSEALKHFGFSLEQNPTTQAVINKANLENNQGDFYKALFTLQEGNNLLPENARIQNNLARQFEKVKILDSARYYYAIAGPKLAELRNNRLALAAQHAKPLGSDSLAWFKDLNKAGKANAAALGHFAARPKVSSANHMYDMVYLNNWLLRAEKQIDAGLLAEAKAAIDSTSNTEYRDQLIYSWSLASYSYGHLTNAVEGLSGLMVNSTEWSEKAKIALGRIYLELGSYNQAITILSDASKGEVNLDLAVAYLEYGQPEKVQEFWQQVAIPDEGFLSEVAKQILQVVYAEEPELTDDQSKYLYCRYNRYFIDESAINSILKLIQDENLRISLALELAEFYHHADNSQGAVLMLQNIEGLGLDMKEYRDYLVLSSLIYKNDELVQRNLDDYDSLYGFTEKEYLLENTLNHLAGIQLDSLDYLALAKDNPFFPDAILIGVNFFKSYPESIDAYEYLAKAVQMNPESPKLLSEYVLLALDMGMDTFAENALAEFAQRFSGQAYLLLKTEYEKKIDEINKRLEEELNE
jgi:hypothetical protein